MSEATTPATIGDEQAVGVVTSIVLPAYNEAKNLPPLLDSIAEMFDESPAYSPYEIVVVDDGSQDDTADVIRSYAAADDRVRGVLMRDNFGQSAALAAGFDAARGEFVVPMDADGQNDPADVPRLLDKLIDEDLDCVSGWRRDRDDPLSKRVPSRIQTSLAKRTGPDINDFGCTLTAYRGEALDEIDLHGEGHRYIPAKLHKLGFDIDELEVSHHERSHGESHYGPGRLVRGFVDLLFQWFWCRYSARPLHLIGGAGILCMVLGTGLGAISLVQKYGLGQALSPSLPRLILTVGLVVVGLQLLVFGVLAELLAKLYYRDEDEYRVERTV